jgi:hypothetical protein
MIAYHPYQGPAEPVWLLGQVKTRNKRIKSVAVPESSLNRIPTLRGYNWETSRTIENMCIYIACCNNN